MRIKMQDGRVFEGTPKQIVQGMQAISMGRHLGVHGYIDFLRTQMLKLDGVELVVDGDTEDERCASLLEALRERGYAEVA